MDGIKEYYKILGAITISVAAIVFTIYTNPIGAIILLIGNISGQILFEEAYKK